MLLKQKFTPDSRQLKTNFFPSVHFIWVPFFNNMSHVAIILYCRSPSKCTFYYAFKKSEQKQQQCFPSLSTQLPFIQFFFTTFTILMMVKETEESSSCDSSVTITRGIYMYVCMQGTHYKYIQSCCAIRAAFLLPLLNSIDT